MPAAGLGRTPALGRACYPVRLATICSWRAAWRVKANSFIWPGFGWQKTFGQDLVKNSPVPLLPHKEFISRMATIVLPGFGRLAKARKSKESKARTPRQSHRGQDAPVTGPGCTGKARQGKARPGYPGKKRSPGKRPGSPGKATGDGQEALAKGLCTTQRARKHRQSPQAKPPKGPPGSPGKATREAGSPGKGTGGARKLWQSSRV